MADRIEVAVWMREREKINNWLSANHQSVYESSLERKHSLWRVDRASIIERYERKCCSEPFGKL